MSKIGSNEFFRALNGHRSVRLPASSRSENFQVQQYKIDKAVRERLKEGAFGVDNSRVINAGCNQSRLSFHEWSRRKSAESRIKKKLMINVYEFEWEQELLKRKDKEMRKEEAQRQVTHWCKRKRVESYMKKQEKIREKSIKVKEEKEKRKEAQEVYRKWLRQNLIKLKIERKKKRLEKKHLEKSVKQKEAFQQNKKQIAEQKYYEWLDSHKFLKRKKRKTKAFSYKPHKKVYGLAYSLNKKKEPILSFDFQDDQTVHQRSGVFEVEENKMFDDKISESDYSDSFISDNQSCKSY